MLDLVGNPEDMFSRDISHMFYCIPFYLQLRLTKANDQLESEKRELAVLIEKRNSEIDRLNGKGLFPCAL